MIWIRRGRSLGASRRQRGEIGDKYEKRFLRREERERNGEQGKVLHYNSNCLYFR
jgi:hypothetical protein